MDLLNLPEEVSEQIFFLLPVQDLLSCCLVNSDWRNAVNKNVIWKRHCNTKLDLENMKSVVNPAFEVSTINSESLSPMCDYKLKYMREVHLHNNLRSNRCVEYSFAINYDINEIELIDKYLFLNESYSISNMFHVWDIEGKPFEVQSVPYLLQQMGTQLFQAKGDCLVIVQCNLLQVYIIDDGVVSLKHCRIFNEQESFSDNIPKINQISSWYCSSIGLYPSDFKSLNEIVGDYFIGIIRQSHGNDSVMHIWDLMSGNKLKKEIIPGTDESLECICTGRNSNCLFISLFLNLRNSAFGGIRCKIYSYDFKKLEFTQFYVESNYLIPFMLIQEKVVVLSCDQWEYSFHDAMTGKKIVETHFDNISNPNSWDSNNQALVIASGNTVTVVDLHTQKELGVFSVDIEDMEDMEVQLLTNNILLVGGVGYHHILEVWDMKLKSRLYRLDERSIMMGRRFLPMLCLQSVCNIHILHYW